MGGGDLKYGPFALAANF